MSYAAFNRDEINQGQAKTIYSNNHREAVAASMQQPLARVNILISNVVSVEAQ